MKFLDELPAVEYGFFFSNRLNPGGLTTSTEDKNPRDFPLKPYRKITHSPFKASTIKLNGFTYLGKCSLSMTSRLSKEKTMAE